jgi:hypothetical protein
MLDGVGNAAPAGSRKPGESETVAVQPSPTNESGARASFSHLLLKQIRSIREIQHPISPLYSSYNFFWDCQAARARVERNARLDFLRIALVVTQRNPKQGFVEIGIACAP